MVIKNINMTISVVMSKLNPKIKLNKKYKNPINANHPNISNNMSPDILKSVPVALDIFYS